VHRDIKPANIVMDDEGSLFVVDFGSVRALSKAGGGSTVAGTFGYMAPEQLQGTATAASDIYGLGMTLVHLLTGVPPEELPKVRLEPDYSDYVSPSKKFDATLRGMIAAVPDDRLQTAAAVRDSLAETALVVAEPKTHLRKTKLRGGLVRMPWRSAMTKHKADTSSGMRWGLAVMSAGLALLALGTLHPAISIATSMLAVALTGGGLLTILAHFVDVAYRKRD